MSISIRKAEPKDSKDIQNVFYKTWLATYPDEKTGVTKEDIEKMYENNFSQSFIASYSEKIENLPDTTLFLVAVDEEKNKIVGLCRIHSRDTYNQLHSIYVLPEYQNRGIGTMLWQTGLSYMKPSKEVIVQVATYNDQAISFYKKLGFTDTGKRFQDEKFKMPVSGVIIPQMELAIRK